MNFSRLAFFFKKSLKKVTKKLAQFKNPSYLCTIKRNKQYLTIKNHFKMAFYLSVTNTNATRPEESQTIISRGYDTYEEAAKERDDLFATDGTKSSVIERAFEMPKQTAAHPITNF